MGLFYEQADRSQTCAEFPCATQFSMHFLYNLVFSGELNMNPSTITPKINSTQMYDIIFRGVLIIFAIAYPYNLVI